MKIGSTENKLPVTPVAGDRKAAGTANAASPAKAMVDSSAQVAISPEATALAASDDGSFDTAKVDRISQAIKDGSFKPNAETIADKLIANAQELLARTYR